MSEANIDTTNRFLVSARGDDISLMCVPPPRFSKADALNLAAYLVSMVGDDDLWQRTLEAVQRS